MDPSLSIEERMAAASAAMNKVEDMHSSGDRDHGEQRAAAMSAAARELESPSLTEAAMAAAAAQKSKAKPGQTGLSLEEEMKKNMKAKRDSKKAKQELEQARKKAAAAGKSRIE